MLQDAGAHLWGHTVSSQCTGEGTDPKPAKLSKGLERNPARVPRRQVAITSRITKTLCQQASLLAASNQKAAQSFQRPGQHKNGILLGKECPLWESGYRLLFLELSSMTEESLCPRDSAMTAADILGLLLTELVAT